MKKMPPIANPPIQSEKEGSKPFFATNEEQAPNGNFFSRGAKGPVAPALQKSPAGATAKKPIRDKDQLAEEKAGRARLMKAIALLGKARSRLGSAAQIDVLDAITSKFNAVAEGNIGILGSDRGRITSGGPLKLFTSFKDPGGMIRPFEYHLWLDISHEDMSADAYFHHNNDYGGRIVFRSSMLASSSIAWIAEVIAHESIHLIADMQRAVTARVGANAAESFPTKQAAGIMDPARLGSHRKTFAVHFGNVRSFLNRQSHRQFSLDKLDPAVVDIWTRMLIEETLAFVYQTRISHGLAAAASKGKGTVTLLFDPISFLNRYMVEHWLSNKEDRVAMKSKEGAQLLKDMTGDLTSLAEAAETQIGPL